MEGEGIGAWVRVKDEHGLASVHKISASNNYITVEGERGGDGTYAKVLNLPSCTPGPEVAFIKKQQDWDLINSSKTIFCVDPEDYSDLGAIEITASGTKDQPRYLLLNNGNNTHPVQLSRN